MILSIPTAIADDVDEVLSERGYWPSKGAFVREACIEKIWNERRKIQELKKTPLKRAWNNSPSHSVYIQGLR